MSLKLNGNFAGSVLYGGAIDNCTLTGLESYNSGEVFHMLSHFEGDNTTPNIFSDPFHVCLCEMTIQTAVSQTRHYQSILVKHFTSQLFPLDREMKQFLHKSEAV